METQSKPICDRRGREIKHLLQRTYPHARFTVRLHKYSLGESIRIATDLLTAGNSRDNLYAIECRSLRGEVLPDADYAILQAHRQRLATNNLIHAELSRLVQQYEHIEYDSATGEILGGGNTYVQITHF